MGLTRPVHVLVVTRADGVPARLAVERQVRALGWQLAWSPADADLLAVCGSAPGHDEVAERIWEQLPGPRARVDVTRVDVSGDAGLHDLLRGAAATLDDGAAQDRLVRATDDASDARQAGEGAHDENPDPADGGRGGMSQGAMGHGDMGHGGTGHGGTGHGDMGHGVTGHGGMNGMDMGGMDTGGMDMSGPAGIPLAASSDQDRDGLEMDEWHVVLGAGLPGWPAGLVVRATLHGDLVTALETLAEPTGGAAAAATLPDGARLDTAVARAALLLDAAASVLDLAGWTAAAGPARRLRDDLLDGGDPGRLVPVAERLVRRVRRSALLRWSLEGARRRPEPGEPGHVVRVRLIALLEAAATSLREPATPLPVPAADGLATLAHLAVGRELGTLRLLVASLALDAREVAHA